MEWHDDGMVLSARPHGEGAAIVEIFTAGHGRHAGLVHGGSSKRMAAHLQPGTQVSLHWRARLEGQLGQFKIEPRQQHAHLLDDPSALAALSTICSMLQLSLPERAPHPALWQVTLRTLQRISSAQLGSNAWAPDYLRWEMGLLDDLGFGLDLSRCALTGSREDLAYVSPRSGRAVARDAAKEWEPRLLPLPPFLLGQGHPIGAELAQAFGLTSHFLARALAELTEAPLPAARARLIRLLTATQQP